jgi:hypothetical protein
MQLLQVLAATPESFVHIAKNQSIKNWLFRRMGNNPATGGLSQINEMRDLAAKIFIIIL